MVHKKCHYLARSISLLFRVVGKFRISLRRVRRKAAKAKIIFFLKSYVRKWVTRKRLHSKTQIVKFL
jgi:hypothetical protein